MYSPKIDKHTPTIYRLSKKLGKPMTKVADELIAYSIEHLNSIYGLKDKEVEEIINTDSN